MTQPTLHYIYDPLCGWCYAAGPLIEAAANAGVPIGLHGGGLFGSPTRVDPAKRNYMRQSDGRIAELAGVRFGPAYLDGLLADPATVFWSRPVIAAIVATGRVKEGAGLPMLRAIQRAHYVEGRRVVENEVLRDLAESIGLAAGDFAQALAHAAVDEHIAATRSLMARAGVQGFPGFLLERSGRLARVEHVSFYGHPADFVNAIATLDQAST
ncbi:MAG: DsbA family protein [Acidovorax sp.]|uniref:DsbA family protein n=1 Tax=Acidovorax sp. TaxID=1872122 RepID=UPI0039E2F3D0